MVAIRKLLASAGLVFFDRGLKWGAKASSYATEIEASLDRAKMPVLIELELDLEDSVTNQCLIIDHHGPNAGKTAPSALRQIAELLGHSPADFAQNREWMLVEANDIGHVAMMRDLNPPATDLEISRIRQADLDAQGVTPAEIELAKAACQRLRNQLDGQLTFVQIENDRTGLVAEFMEPFMGGPGFENLLIEGQSEFGFFGSGELVSTLIDASSGSACWSGGALPETGFWGCPKPASFEPLELLVSSILGR